MKTHVVLCVDDDRSILNALRRLLRREDYQLLVANSGAEGLEILSQQPVHVVISDMKMPQMTGAEFLEQVKQRHIQTVRLALSGYADADIILNAVNQGQIYQYLIKPWRDGELKLAIQQALAHYDLMSENRKLTDLTDQQAQELQDAYEEIKAWNQKLEQRVEEQTAELRETYDNLKRTQSQLLQNDKMAAIGQLAAGVAHEINNPVAFVSSNLNTLGEYLEDLQAFLDENGQVMDSLKGIEHPAIPDLVSRVEASKDTLDIDFVMEDLADIVEESKSGIERVRDIVQDLKDFAHIDEAEHQLSDINEGLEKTLQLLWNELKYKAKVDKDYGDIPQISCMPRQLNQVFMNLLVNAAQAIEQEGLIRIKTHADETNVYIEIADTGCGISAESLSKIFDAFFTTKPVGKGTGLGLSISYSIIQKHGGDIRVESEMGKGTTFFITLPIEGME
ncbi:MAG: ATP-binding protein, partial [Candidatus Poribacteria bacterium]|nr:ATP-binding protein [Candidatus Poribacteria bacterium]